MISLDTNYLLRFFTNDIKSQALIARRIIKEEKEVYISPIVMAETVYFLRNYYKKDKISICKELDLLIRQPNIKADAYISLALHLYQSEPISFYDCLFVAEALLHKLEIKTFDEKLAKVFSKYRSS